MTFRFSKLYFALILDFGWLSYADMFQGEITLLSRTLGSLSYPYMGVCRLSFHLFLSIPPFLIYLFGPFFKCCVVVVVVV